MTGTVSYDPSLQGILTGAGTTTLGVVGAPVTIDATALYPGASSVVINSEINEPTSAPLTFSFLPGAHGVEVARVGLVNFTVNDDGTVSYESTEDSELSGAGTKTLIVKSVT